MNDCVSGLRFLNTALPLSNKRMRSIIGFQMLSCIVDERQLWLSHDISTRLRAPSCSCSIVLDVMTASFHFSSTCFCCSPISHDIEFEASVTKLLVGLICHDVFKGQTCVGMLPRPVSRIAREQNCLSGRVARSGRSSLTQGEHVLISISCVSVPALEWLIPTNLSVTLLFS